MILPGIEFWYDTLKTIVFGVRATNDDFCRGTVQKCTSRESRHTKSAPTKIL